MSLVILAVIAFVGYLHWSGTLTTRALERLIAGGIGLLALRLGFGGSPIGGLALGALAATLALRSGSGRMRPVAQSEADARALLGVGPLAAPDEIRAAHRRLAADAHPDLGGNTQAMQALNAARDLLLRHGDRS